MIPGDRMFGAYDNGSIVGTAADLPDDARSSRAESLRPRA